MVSAEAAEPRRDKAVRQPDERSRIRLELRPSERLPDARNLTALGRAADPRLLLNRCVQDLPLQADRDHTDLQEAHIQGWHSVQSEGH